MPEETISKTLFDKYDQEKNYDAIAYLVEMLSLQTELSYLYIYFREKHALAEENILETDITKQYLDDYSFYLKNCIYRIYDFQNKYALFMNSIIQYVRISPNSLEKKFPGWFTLLKALENTKLSPYKKVIIKTKNNPSLKEITQNRYLMTHRKLILPSSTYISSYVLPLGGEEAKSKGKWIKESKSTLDEAISALDLLFSETIKIILIKASA